MGMTSQQIALTPAHSRPKYGVLRTPTRGSRANGRAGEICPGSPAFAGTSGEGEDRSAGWVSLRSTRATARRHVRENFVAWAKRCLSAQARRRSKPTGRIETGSVGSARARLSPPYGLSEMAGTSPAMTIASQCGEMTKRQHRAGRVKRSGTHHACVPWFAVATNSAHSRMCRGDRATTSAHSRESGNPDHGKALSFCAGPSRRRAKHAVLRTAIRGGERENTHAESGNNERVMP